MRYLRYTDVTLYPVVDHFSGYIVGRKPIVVSFGSKAKMGRKNARRGNATRLAQAFSKKLWRKA